MNKREMNRIDAACALRVCLIALSVVKNRIADNSDNDESLDDAIVDGVKAADMINAALKDLLRKEEEVQNTEEGTEE